MKNKILFILHYSPPSHGASKVGDFIKDSQKIQDNFNCKFIKIKSSNTLKSIGKINPIKFYYVIELYFKILFYLILFRPNKVYFTASSKGFAFYRDIVICTSWKIFSRAEIFYHYHTKGINDFISYSKIKLRLTKFFLKNINLVLLSPLLENDFKKVQTYKKVLFLPNGVENNISEDEFYKMMHSKFDHKNINILYLSNMIKEKGYFDVLKLAKTSNQNINFHFAGGWQDENDKKEFFDYIGNHNLQNKVFFHGFVGGEKKHNLLKSAHLFAFPSKYPNEAFPLSLLEALSYGIAVISCDEGSISSIINENVGIIGEDISQSLNYALENFCNLQTAKLCRSRYQKLFTLEKFENNIIKVLS